MADVIIKKKQPVHVYTLPRGLGTCAHHLPELIHDKGS